MLLSVRIRKPQVRRGVVGPALGLGAKVRHEGWDLWKDCMNGVPEAWAIMEKYNKQDVILLEKLYNKLQPWIDQHPNRNMYTDRPVCPNCGANALQSRGVYKTTTQEYIRYHCTGCGKWSRARKATRTERPVTIR